jgi:hypothetical protein
VEFHGEDARAGLDQVRGERALTGTQIEDEVVG